MKKGKKYLTIEEQINLLNSRGVETDEFTPMKLLFENYFKVVNGYKYVFLEQNNIYKEGTHFNEIYALFQFDRDLKSLFLKRILIMENRIKSVLSNSFAKYGLTEYLVLENFLDEKEIESLANGTNSKKLTNKIVSITGMISKIHATLSMQFKKKNQYITHHVKKYGRVPFWILVTTLSFGEMSIFFSNMKSVDQDEVANKFNLDSNTMQVFLKHMTTCRNVTAHDERFFSYRTSGNSLNLDLEIYNFLGINKVDNVYEYGVEDTFSLVIILKYFLLEAEFLNFVSRLDDMIDELATSLKTVSVDLILKEMGFPLNWKEIINYTNN